MVPALDKRQLRRHRRREKASKREEARRRERVVVYLPDRRAEMFDGFSLGRCVAWADGRAC